MSTLATPPQKSFAFLSSRFSTRVAAQVLPRDREPEDQVLPPAHTQTPQDPHLRKAPHPGAETGRGGAPRRTALRELLLQRSGQGRARCLPAVRGDAEQMPVAPPSRGAARCPPAALYPRRRGSLRGRPRGPANQSPPPPPGPALTSCPAP